MSVPQLSALAAAARGLALDVHAAEVVAALDAAGIASVLLKGPGLARRLYADDVARRRYSDVDLLVAPGSFDRAQQVLADLGHRDVAGEFPTDEWLPHERSWRLEPAGLTVDLHRGFAGADDPEALYRLLIATAEPMDLEGRVVRVPGSVGCALLVALHAAAPGRGRKALTDLARGLERLSGQDWAEAARWASATGSTEAFGTGLRRTEEGARLAEALVVERASSPVGRVAERLDLVLLHRALHALGRVPGGRAKVRYVARRLVPTPDFLRMASSTARRGRLGLVVAYATRPLRLLQPAPRDRDVRRRPLRSTTWLTPDPRRWSVLGLRTAVWTWSTLRRVRRELVATPLADLDLPTAPPRARAHESTVRRWLHRSGATCLERALVLQRWRAGQGTSSEVVVGVTAPGSGFRAHAWLADDADAEHQHTEMTTILTRPAPAAWLAG